MTWILNPQRSLILSLPVVLMLSLLVTPTLILALSLQLLAASLNLLSQLRQLLRRMMTRLMS